MENKILDTIKTPSDIKGLSHQQTKLLCDEIRQILIENVMQTGGHLASNLGVVELTVALHKNFDFARDRLIFDVGHQSYVHKILTGRKDIFNTLRTFGGISGFPKPSESVYDAFIAGHATTSISVALGMARAAKINGEDRKCVAIIGDGALTGGMAYEAMNDAGQDKLPIIAILNDNEMSIAKSVGGVADYLSRLRLKKSYINAKRHYHKILKKIPGNKYINKFLHKIKDIIREASIPGTMFEQFGWTYLGPIDGHNEKNISYLLSVASELKKPVLLHIYTKKGKGHKDSEQNPENYHGISANALNTTTKAKSFSDVFGEAMLNLAEQNKKLCAITAAMPHSTGLLEFSKKYNDRFFDVSIAEQHAVTLASAMAKSGLTPVVAIYSTFLQRAYDQILHDSAILSLPVIFAVDRAGLVGEDGETHHGVFDVAFLSSIPNVEIYAPSNFDELKYILNQKTNSLLCPTAIRYPRGSEGNFKENTMGSDSVCLFKGKDITIVSYGILINKAIELREMLKQNGIDAGIIKLNKIKDIELTELLGELSVTKRLAVYEDVVKNGSVSQTIALSLAKKNIALKSFLSFNFENRFVTHGTIDELYLWAELDVKTVCKKITEELKNGTNKA